MRNDHIHHLRKLRDGSRMRYECMDCGKRLRILSGIIVATTAAEVERYYRARRDKAVAQVFAEQGEHEDENPHSAGC